MAEIGTGVKPTTYAIVAFLDLAALPWGEELREKYDPLARRVAAHLTLVHPFTTTLAPQQLESHIHEVSRSSEVFTLELRGVTGHQHEYLFLNVKRGNDEVIAIRDALYSGLLARFLDASVTYVPHVTVGRLASPTQFQEALRALHEHSEPVLTSLDRLSCYRINQDGKRVILTESHLGRLPSSKQ